MLTFAKPRNIDFEELARISAANPSSSTVATDMHFSFPHDIYLLSFKSLKDEAYSTPILSGQRIIETSGENFISIFDVHTHDNESGVQMFLDEEFRDAYEKAFETVAAFANDATTYAVRLLKVPPLYAEAIWLANESNADHDKFIPVRQSSSFVVNTVYARDAFFEILRSAARQKATFGK